MSIEVCVLASGSSGNCTVVRTPAGTLLFDAGLGPRNTARRLNGTGVRLSDIAGICPTHLDLDHFSPEWVKRDIRIFCHEGGVEKLSEMGGPDAMSRVTIFRDRFEPLPGVMIESIELAHDQKSCRAFVMEGFDCRIGYATDLGQVPASLINAFTRLDLLALESNYDPQMQMDSTRPWFLKQRIMGGRGHLSNEQAFEAVRNILNRHQSAGHALPAHVVLLHRSRQCNCPKVVRKLFETDARLRDRLTLAEQFQPTQWLRVRPSKPLVGEQMMLSWG
jgi:phosphoribosyl 1,2-cyclic phosphodiesterase